MPHLGFNSFEKLVELAYRLLRVKREIESRESKLSAYPTDGNKASIVIGGTCGSGTAVNIVPREAWLTIDRRILPEETLDEARKELMNEIMKFEEENLNIGVQIEEMFTIRPTHVPSDHKLIKQIKETLLEVLGIDGRPVLCPGFLNTRYFIEKGMPAVAWGPGDLNQAHAPNEYINLEKLKMWCESLMFFLITSLSSYK